MLKVLVLAFSSRIDGGDARSSLFAIFSSHGDCASGRVRVLATHADAGRLTVVAPSHLAS